MNECIFSGEKSRKLWDNINNLGPLHTCEDVGDVLYDICCHLQELETKYDDLLAALKKEVEK